MRLWAFVLCFSIPLFTYSQNTLMGQVLNSYGDPISNAHVDLQNNCTKTNEEGYFELKQIVNGNYLFRIQAEGYQVYETTLSIPTPDTLHIVLTESTSEVLNEMVIHADHLKAYNASKFTSRNIQEHFQGSLASTLAVLPGVQVMEIGSGTSKPIIRGLGFNRIAVTENGIKQEGQQWGADHGLEIDALQTEDVEIVKRVGAIEYGSDAIAGVIRINNEKIPTEEGTSGRMIFYGKTVNNAMGTSAILQHKKDNWFYKAKFSGVDYADFKVPTNEIYYLNTKIPVHHNRMKNTAGQEYSGYLQGGYVSNHFQSILSVSNVSSKVGFFPGAHGIPSVTSVADDGDIRNVGFPYQSVNHFKLISNSKWMNDHSSWQFSFGFQQNHRQEISKFHTHYSNQQAPELHPDVELDFLLNTLDSQLSYEFESNLNHVTTVGVQQNFQKNQVAGYSYLLPAFQKEGLGFFMKHHWDVSEKWLLEAGARFDFSKMNVAGFYDTVLYDYLISIGKDDATAGSYAQRSTNLNKTYQQANFSLGSSYEASNEWRFTFTAGTNFRLPTAMELSANGIHHGAFRHEKGNPNLSPEKGGSAEIGVNYTDEHFSFAFNPYVYYFTNYIFLKPTGTFSILPHGGQVYEYSQSKALITGFDFSVKKQFGRLGTEVVFEYLYNKQITNSGSDYPLPFTPPMNVYAEVSYLLNTFSFLHNTQIQLNTRWASEQQRIAQNEQITPSYWILGLGLQTELGLGALKPTIRLQASNLCNTKYYSHSSFYRAIEIPELGRNVQFMISIPF